MIEVIIADLVSSRTDDYRVFKGMLEDGNPPDGCKVLLATIQTSTGQLAELMEQR